MVKIRTEEEINAAKKKKAFRYKTIFAQQAEFMKACGQTVDKYNPKQALLYLDLIHEEFNELTLDAESDAEIADAIIDTIVVLVGYGLSHGWPMNKLWREVMDSNMAKIDPTTGKVKKRRDGKVLKPKGWQPPNINDILMRHSARKKV